MRIGAVTVFAVALCAYGSDIREALKEADQLYRTGNLEAAESLLARHAAAANTDLLAVAVAWTDLAVIQQDTGRVREAERSFKKALKVIDSLPDDINSRTLRMRTSGNLASLHLENNQPGKAERILRRFSAPDNPRTDDEARMTGTHASLYLVRGALAEAETMFLTALRYWVENGRHSDAAIVNNNLSVIAMMRENPQAALPYLERSMEHWRAAGLVHHPLALRTMINYGGTLLRCRQPERARPLIEEAMAIATKWFGAGSMMHGTVSMAYAEMLEATGRGKEAKSVRAEARNAAVDPGRHTVDVLDLQPRRR